MKASTVRIEGVEYTLGTATVGDAEAIAPIAGMVLKPGELGAGDVTHHAGDLINAVATLTGCRRDIVARQPLAEFLRIFEETAAGWIAQNSAYVNEQVAPAFNDLIQRMQHIMDAAEQHDAKL